MDILNLTLGEKFEHDIPPEAMSVVLMNGVPLIAFNFTLNAKNIADFQNGACSFGLFTENTALFFLFKIDGFLDWSDLAFTIHLAQEETLADNDGYLPFALVLVDSQTSLIKGLRMVTVTPEFRSVLAGIIRQQAQERFDTIAYYKTIGLLYDRFPSATDMLNKAVIVEQGGINLPD
jgi:hypothetical protein